MTKAIAPARVRNFDSEPQELPPPPRTARQKRTPRQAFGSAGETRRNETGIGLSRREVAEATGLTERTIRRLENGLKVATLTIADVRKYAQAISCMLVVRTPQHLDENALFARVFAKGGKAWFRHINSNVRR